jgi:lysophospholipase L1-like esterase
VNDTDSSPDLAYIRLAISFMAPIRSAGIPFAVVAVPYTSDAARNHNVEQVNKVLAAVSTRMGGHFLPLATFPQDERTHDGIHFTTAGYQDLASRVVSELLPAY